MYKLSSIKEREHLTILRPPVGSEFVLCQANFFYLKHRFLIAAIRITLIILVMKLKLSIRSITFIRAVANTTPHVRSGISFLLIIAETPNKEKKTPTTSNSSEETTYYEYPELFRPNYYPGRDKNKSS